MRYIVSLILILALVSLLAGCPSETTTTTPAATSPAPTTASPTTASPSPTTASPLPSTSSPVPTVATPSLTASPSPGATTASPSGTAAGQTFGQVSALGNTVFTNSCAGCHGNNGQGVSAPAVVGTNANLQKYTTAQGLLDFIRTAMPANAPGSLPTEQYQQVLAFILVKNNFVAENTAFNPNQLATIPLNRTP